MKHYEIVKEASKLGLGVQVSRPGDGRTRYEFLTLRGDGFGRTLALCLGRREAEVWLAGFADGYAAGDDDPRRLV